MMKPRIFNDKTASLADLVVKDARELANQLATKDETTKSQIRRFYQEYVTLRQSIPRGDKEAYRKFEVPLKLLIAKVAYAAGRRDSKISNEFKEWLEGNLKALQGPDDVHDFGDYFEAFVGYFYGSKPEQQDKSSSR